MRLLLAAALAALAGALLPAAAPAAGRGVIHAVIGPQRVLPAPGLPDIPPAGSIQEVWFNRDGTGWRSRQTLSGEGYVEEVADLRGARIFDSRTGRMLTLPRGDRRLDDDYLTDPWLGPYDAVIDPLDAVRRRTSSGAAPVAVVSVAVAGAPAVLTGDGSILSARTIGPGDPAPRTQGPQRRGAPLPRDRALVEATVRLPAGRPERHRWHRLTLTCPAGFVQAGGLSAGGGPRSRDALGSVGIWSRSQRTAGRSRRGVIVFRPRPRLDRPATARLGIVCMTPPSYWRQKRASMRQECAIFRRLEREQRAAGRRPHPDLVRARRINCRWRHVGP